MGLTSLRVGSKAQKSDLIKLCRRVGEVLLSSVGVTDKDKDYNFLLTDTDFRTARGKDDLDYVNFSGGVADFIYNDYSGDEFKYGDIGIILGKEIKKVFEEKGVKVVKTGETIGATVVGAGSHTTEISGSTITYTDDIFPLKNIPVLRIAKSDEMDLNRLSINLKKKREWFKVEDGIQDVAVGLTGQPNMKYKDILRLADIIYDLSLIHI